MQSSIASLPAGDTELSKHGVHLVYTYNLHISTHVNSYPATQLHASMLTLPAGATEFW